MDIGLYLQVARRHQKLVIVGVAVTFALAFLSVVRVSPSGIGYRSTEVWSNDATIALSQPGYPEYRSLLPNGQAPSYGNVTSLTDLYAAYATSDAVVALLEKEHYIADSKTGDGQLPIAATPLSSPLNGAPTPLISMSASGKSPVEATKLVKAATDAFIAVLTDRQNQAKIPAGQRIEVRVVKRQGEPKLIVPRSKTPAIILILAGLTITFAAAFIRDNMRRTRSLGADHADRELVEVKLSEHAPPTPAPEVITTGAVREDEVPATSQSRWSARSAS